MFCMILNIDVVSVNPTFKSKWCQDLDSRCVLLSDPSPFGAAGGPKQNTPR